MSYHPGSILEKICAMLPAMDVRKIVQQLRTERAQIEEAITALERLAGRQAKQRGWPPASMAATKRRGRPPGSKNKPKAEAAE